jgi:hypothetical protein
VRVGDITTSGSSARAVLGGAWLIISYTLALFLSSFGVGLLWGIIRLAFGIPNHSGGGVDADLIVRIIGTIFVGAIVYRRLARKHSENYLVLGTPVAVITGLISGVLGTYLGVPPRLWLFVVCVAIHTGLMVLTGLFFGGLKVPPNNRWRGP